jgi:hypothetical protein
VHSNPWHASIHVRTMSQARRRERIHVNCTAGSLLVTCRNVSLLDATLAAALLAGGVATVCTIGACIHVFLKFAWWDGSPVILLHLGWSVGGAFMILLSVNTIIKLIPRTLNLVQFMLTGTGDTLRIDAVSWKLVCRKPESDSVGLYSLLSTPSHHVHSGATSGLKGALVRLTCYSLRMLSELALTRLL